MAKREETDHALERLVFFSDAVFAIAITLLIIEIHVPDLSTTATNTEAWQEFASLIPSLIAYLISFFVIGRFWMGHHRAFGAVRRYDEAMVWPNLQYLMAIAFMPFATAFMGRNFGHFVPALVYNLSMLVCALLNWRLWLVLLRAGDMAPERTASFNLRSTSVLLGAASCVALTFISPMFSQAGMFTMPVWNWVLSKWQNVR